VRPKGTGKGPLANDPSFVNTTCPKCGGKAERETDTMDTFVCSSFYFLRYPNVGDDTKMMNPEITKKWLPIDMYVGGAEHVTMHLLYARFITKALYDAKMITFDEPFSSLRHQGMILGPDGKKMSKSKGNVVIPNEVIDKDGADSFRTYILFMGPFEDGGPWNPKGLIGIRRFLEKYWRLSQEVIENLGIENPEQNIYSSKEIEGTALKRAVSKTVKKVGEDIESFKFNTAISSLMECLNSMYEFKGKQPIKELTHDWKEALKNYTIILSPFAPHIAEEVWESLGEKESIFRASWPFVEEKLIEEETITIPIQINGKVRGEILIAKGLDQKKVEKEALANEKIKKYTEGKEIKRVIYVKDKLLSIVI
ncbi:MAG: class I tRNA ligase family protein, partial [Patescibacteria group bacterium]|nr:class I tRNA ligase family protein [Patescibacteria group bacterium]